MSDTLAQFSRPSLGSTLAFLGVITFVCAAWLAAVARAFRGHPARRRALVTTAAILALTLVLTAFLAETGAFASLAERGLLIVYIVTANGSALAVALSPIGRRIAHTAPLSALVGVQAFRLPLELVLHSWYEQGSLPVQMTYSGDNWDILTGIISLIAAALIQWEAGSSRARRALAWGSNTLGLLLLLRVMSIALRSIPGLARTYPGPPLLVAFHAPYTWIVPICVAGALAGHVITFRALRANRGEA